MKLQLLGGCDVTECGHRVSVVLKQAGFDVMSLESCAKSVQTPPPFSFWSLNADATAMENCSVFMH